MCSTWWELTDDVMCCESLSLCCFCAARRRAASSSPEALTVFTPGSFHFKSVKFKQERPGNFIPVYFTWIKVKSKLKCKLLLHYILEIIHCN